MPKILSFNGVDPKDLKQNPIKALWEWFQSQDKFIKSTVVIATLLIIATPVIIGSYLTFFQHASSERKPMAMGISTDAGGDNRWDENSYKEDVEVLKTKYGQYPGSYIIWTYIWKPLPSTDFLNYLDSRSITPSIYMMSDGPELHQGPGKTIDAAWKYSNNSIAGTNTSGPYQNGNGSFDEYFRTWASAAKTYGKPVILRYDHEMNGSWFPWGVYSGTTFFNLNNNATNYIEAWRHIYKIMHDEIGATNVKFYWCPSGAGGKEFYPGNDYVDYVGFDIYIRSGNSTMLDMYTGPINSLRNIVGNDSTSANHTRKKIIIGETGAKTTVPQRSNWIAQGYPAIYNNYSDVVGINYFNRDASIEGNNWYLEADPEMVTAYRQLSNDPRFQGNLSFEPPPASTGSLQVNISPSGASAGRWKVDGGAFKTSGTILSDLTAGEHTVSFKTITGWTKPADQTVTVVANQTTTVTGEYATTPGSLQVNISPSGAVNAGAQWQVDGGEFQNSGVTVSGLSAGSHTVAFKTITGWNTPVSKTVTVRANQTTTTTGAYTPVSTLSIKEISTLADTYISQNTPRQNYGRSYYMRADASPFAASYLKFNLNLSSLRGKTITKATLTLTVSDVPDARSALAKGIVIKSASNSWSENSLTFNNKPNFGTPIASFTGQRYPNQTIKVDITSFIQNHLGELVSLSLENKGSDGVIVDTREASKGKPTLTIEYH